MNGTVLLASQVRYEQKAFWRNPAAGVFTFGFPIIFLAIFGATSGHSTNVGGTHFSYSQYLVPTMLAYGLMNACFSNLAVTTVMRRESGILKRVRGTPLPTWTFMGGVIGNALVMSVILVVITVGIGMVFYGLAFPPHVVAAVVTILAGAVAFCSMGLALTGFVPNSESAPAVVNAVYLPIVFISGVFYPVSTHSAIGRIGALFPVRHFTQALLSAFEPGTTGNGFQTHQLLILAIWAVAALWIATRRFRWEPRRS